jgi:hypothetical protein
MRRASSTVQSTAKVSAYVEQVLAPALRPGEIVVMDNSPHAGGVRRARSARTKAARSAAPFALLAPISCFCRRTRRTSIQSSRSSQTSKHFSEKPRTIDGLWRRIGGLLDTFAPGECANYLKRRICFYLNPKGSRN